MYLPVEILAQIYHYTSILPILDLVSQDFKDSYLIASYDIEKYMLQLYPHWKNNKECARLYIQQMAYKNHWDHLLWIMYHVSSLGQEYTHVVICGLYLLHMYHKHDKALQMFKICKKHLISKQGRIKCMPTHTSLIAHYAIKSGISIQEPEIKQMDTYQMDGFYLPEFDSYLNEIDEGLHEKIKKSKVIYQQWKFDAYISELYYYNINLYHLAFDWLRHNILIPMIKSHRPYNRGIINMIHKICKLSRDAEGNLSIGVYADPFVIWSSKKYWGKSIRITPNMDLARKMAIEQAI